MRTLTITLWVVLAITASVAVPITEDENSQISREKRSPPEEVWKKKLVWKEELKQIWKTEKSLVWKPEWKKEKVQKKIWVEKWKQIQVPVWKSIEVPAWIKVWKPVWVPIHHEHHGWD